MAERQSPDGGEDNNLSTKAVKGENLLKNSVSVATELSTINLNEENISKLMLPSSEKSKYFPPLRDGEDLHSLDIKSTRTGTKQDSRSDDIELIFKDMEPVILQTATMNISGVSSKIQKSKFEPVDVDLDSVSGWEDDESESDVIGMKETN